MKICNILKLTFLSCVCLLTAACATGTVPVETHDGLVLVPDARFSSVYKRPGAQLDDFRGYGLAGCEVAFRKNWQRDQNNSRLDLSNRVTQKDVARIKDSLSASCEKTFRDALEQAPGYTLVDSFDNGEPVLILRPSIINLDINAPDIQSAGMSRNYTTEMGEMTLSLEVVDGTTGEVLYRIVDRQRGRDTMRLQWTNLVTNQAEANRMLKRWAGQLRQGLDELTAHTRAQ